MGKFDAFVQEATKEKSYLRMAVDGPSGSGKTFTAINIAMEMGCENLLVLDTEQGSAAKYRKDFPRKFKVIDNTLWKGKYPLALLTEVLQELGSKHDAIICDSLSHFWFAPGGALDQVEMVAKRQQQNSRGGKYDSYAAWKVVTKDYQDLITTILNLPCHFIGCMRSKTEYEDREVNGRKTKVRVGMQAQMRDGFEYEFDVQGSMDYEHVMTIVKSRVRALDNQSYPLPGANIAKPILAWLSDYDVDRKSEPKVKAAPISETRELDDEDEDEVTPSSKLVSPFPKLKASIEAATDENELSAAGAQIKEANTNKQLSEDEYRALSKAYSEKRNALKAAA